MGDFPNCEWWSHLPWPIGNPRELHAKKLRESSTGQIAHVRACDGKDYCLATVHMCGGRIRPGNLTPWDRDFERSIYDNDCSNSD